jgi:flagella basal body P-ring formation protein FlgA
MNAIASLAIALFVAGSVLADARAAVLRPNITVESDVVRLGDLFADVGERSDAVVAPAPAPGGKVVFNAARLQSIARSSGLSWRPQSRYQHAVVVRSGRLVSALDIEYRIRTAMVKAGLPSDRQIALSKPDMTFHVAPDEDRDIRIVNARYNLSGNQFSAIVEVPRGSAGTERIQVTGSVYEELEVPVLARRVQRGETIQRGDLDFIKMRRDAVARNAVIDVAGIVGKEPRRLLTVGQPLRAVDLQMPLLVEKENLVTLVLQNRNMLITAQGRAMESGAKGDVIRVVNTRSRATVQGVVVGPNRVTIQFPGSTH